MQKFKSFPDLGLGFRRMLLQDKLREVHTESILGYCIHTALDNGRPLNEIGATILSQYNDSPLIVLGVVPQETIDLIKEVCK